MIVGHRKVGLQCCVYSDEHGALLSSPSLSQMLVASGADKRERAGPGSHLRPWYSDSMEMLQTIF